MARGVKKMALGGVLGALVQGDIRGAIPGVVPHMLLDRQQAKESAGAAAAATAKQEEEKRQKRKGASRATAVQQMNAPRPMAKGGKVRGDGCCMKGHTKGMMR
jgi:hypothetical protein